jgi:NTE family protein
MSKESGRRDEGAPKVGLVLCGGGGKGPYQLGAIRALVESGIKFSVLAGTSTGAVNGALLLSCGVGEAENVWIKSASCRLFIPRPLGIAVGVLRGLAFGGVALGVYLVTHAKSFGVVGASGIAIAAWILGLGPWRSGILDGVGLCAALAVAYCIVGTAIWRCCEALDVSVFRSTKLKLLLAPHLSWKRIIESKVPLYVTVASSCECGAGLLGRIRRSTKSTKCKAEYVRIDTCSEERALDFIAASASIPFGVFQKIVIDGREYWDGGLVDNAPVRPVLMEGCSVVFVIHTDQRTTWIGGAIKPGSAMDSERVSSSVECSEAGWWTGSTLSGSSGGRRGSLWSMLEMNTDAAIGSGFPVSDAARIVHVFPSRPLGSLLGSIALWARRERVIDLIGLGYRDASSTIEALRSSQNLCWDEA